MEPTFLSFLETSLSQVKMNKKNAEECEVDIVVIGLHDEFISYIEQLKNIVENNSLAVNYTMHFQNDINNTLGYLTYRFQNFIPLHERKHVKYDMEQQKDNLSKQLQSSKFNLKFFQKLNFFGDNIVAIGANGSGKTTLSNKLKQYLPQTAVVISAQKILIIPTFSGISDINQTSQKLHQSQQEDKSFKCTYNIHSANSHDGINANNLYEFGILLNNLIADNVSKILNYHKTLEDGASVQNKPITILDKVLKIWNSLITHRNIECEGINLILKSIEQESYKAYQMSDGEKVALYLIAQVLQAPKNGFVIVDEPEMHLHKTILKKLWDILEQERNDCIFVYLTHDLDFATSRVDARKLWVKSYEYPDKWEIEDIPENELPEALLLELLGSRKPILFCEGKKGNSLDEKIYNCLFPDYTITSVESCFSVINYTRAFNKISNKTTKAFGIIDSDYRNEEELNSLKQDNIYSLSVAEIENLLLNEGFLKLFAKERIMQDDGDVTRMQIIEDIKSEVVSELGKNIIVQVSNYVSAKINYYFKSKHLKKGNSENEVKDNYNSFAAEINIPGWYSQREIELNEIVKCKDYAKVLTVYNNKGLKYIVEKYFNTSDFTNKAIKFLQLNKAAQRIIKQCFPQELINCNLNKP